MPFSGSVFTLPNGATNALPGQIVQSAVWNAIHADLNTGLTMVMSQLVSEITLRNLAYANGDFALWQRGAGGTAVISVAASTQPYTADRWYLNTNANQAFTVSQVTSLTTAAISAAKVQRTAGQVGIGTLIFGYPFSTQDIIRFRGFKVTLTFIVKAGANWSPANGTLTYAVGTGTATPIKIINGYSGRVDVINSAVNLAAGVLTAVSATASIIIPANATQAEVFFAWTPVGTAGTDDSVTIDSVQVEADLSATIWTPTNYDRIPQAQQLVDCKSYYRKTFPYSVAPAQNGGLLGSLVVLSQAAVQQGYQWDFEDMFQSPVVVTYNPQGASANWQDITAVASLAVTVNTTSATNSAKILYLQSASAAAATHQLCIHASLDAGI